MKMSGRCYNHGGNSSTTWANDWNNKHADNSQEEYGSVCDVQSQCSDAASELNPVEIPDVKERVRHLFESQSFTDVTFYPKNNRSTSISAHRAILAISSPLFKKMLFDNQSKINVSEKLEVQISNISFEAFICIVKYIYTDEVFFENEALVQGILDGANEFGISSLVTKCKEYFEDVELTSKNVCSKLQMSISNKIIVLKRRCSNFIQSNTLHVIQSSDFKQCNSKTIQAICKLQSFNLRSEIELLEGVMYWLQAQPYHDRKSLLEPLLKCIRFLSFGVGEMGDTLKKYPELMTADEGLSIMLFLYNPPKNPNFTTLPTWCNKNMQNRCFFKEEDLGASRRDLNVTDPNGTMVGKVFFPLKSDPGQGFVSDLTSLLQMKCISGQHQINAIRLSFERPMSEKCRINSLSIKVHVSPSNFEATEHVQIVNSESVRVEFRKVIKVRRGDTLDIEAEAKNIEFYKFLQFDDSGRSPIVSYSPHFNTCISSSPKYGNGKLYFISEIEYGPQDRGNMRPQFPPKRVRNRNLKK